VHRARRILRRDLHGGVRRAGGGAADQQRQGEAAAVHLPGDMHHLVERGRDEAGEADEIGLFFARGGEDLFAWHHHPEVDDLVVVAGEHDADDVLADVVHITLDGGHDDPALGAVAVPAAARRFFSSSMNGVR